ncbi:MAG: winged helix-turn-helix transcriptional regulator [Candidatus Hodarchaeales archaeon]
MLGKKTVLFLIIASLFATTTSVNRTASPYPDIIDNSIYNEFSTVDVLLYLDIGVFLSAQTGTCTFTYYTPLKEFIDQKDRNVRLFFSTRTATISDLNILLIDFLTQKNHSLILIALPALFVPLGSDEKTKRNKEDGLTMRAMIHRTIEMYPGIHFRELCRELNKKNGVVQYHLWILEDSENKIKSHQDGGFTRYFPSNSKLAKEDLYFNIFSMLQRPSMYTIIKLLWESKNGLSRTELSSTIGISLQGVTCNCKKLSTACIIQETRLNRQKYYMLTDGAIEFLDKLDWKI